MDYGEGHYNWLVYGGFLLLHIGISLHILLTKREQPNEALFWLLLVALFPVGGEGYFGGDSALHGNLLSFRHFERWMRRGMYSFSTHSRSYGISILPRRSGSISLKKLS